MSHGRSTRSRNSSGQDKGDDLRNEGENGPRFSVQIVRLYKSEKGWESSSSFGRDELPLVAKVADMVHTWIFQEGTECEAPEQQSSESRDRLRNGRTATAAR